MEMKTDKIALMSMNVLLAWGVLALATTAQAGQSMDVGKYTIHYSAFTSDTLTPSVAKEYNIPRSRNRALLNVSVLKRSEDGTTESVNAIIRGTATNLNQQLRNLVPRKISSQGAVYYIAETPVKDAEVLKYELEVTPEGETTPYKIAFQEQFYSASN